MSDADKPKPLSWNELANLYDKEHQRPARTLPMDIVWNWAVAQTDRFYIMGDYLYMKVQKQD